MALAEIIVNRFLTKLGSGSPVAARGTGVGSMAVDQVAPARFEMSRAGRRFLLGNSAAITGIAPVQGLPTTAAQWALFNADAARAVVLEQVGMYLTAGTPGAGGILLGCLFQLPAQSGALYAGTAISSASGGGLASKAVLKSAVTITAPAAPNWFPLASNPSPNAAIFPGSTFLENRALDGAILVPPGWGLGLAVVAPAGTTPLFAPFASWVEVEAELE